MLSLKPELVAATIVKGCEPVISDFNEGVIAQETSMTDRLFQTVSTTLSGATIGGLHWRSRTLKSARGSGGEERRHGADLLGVLEIDLPEYKVKKGFLLQAKVMEPGKPPGTRDWKKFQDQCQTMLSRTSDAFAVIYSRGAGVRFIPAAIILEIRRDQVFDVGSRTLFGFFKAHVKCEVGDRRLSYPTVAFLDSLFVQDAQPRLDVPDRLVLAMEVADE